MKFAVEFKGVVTTNELKDIFIDLFKKLVEVNERKPPKIDYLSEEVIKKFWKNPGICSSIKQSNKYYLSYCDTFDDNTVEQIDYQTEVLNLYPFVKLPTYLKDKDWFDNNEWILKNLIKYDSSPIALRVIELTKLLNI